MQWILLRSVVGSTALKALTPIDDSALSLEVRPSMASLFDRHGFLAALTLKVPADQNHVAA